MYSHITVGSLPNGLFFELIPNTLCSVDCFPKCLINLNRVSWPSTGTSCTVSPIRRKLHHSLLLPSFELLSIGPPSFFQESSPPLNAIPGASMQAPDELAEDRRKSEKNYEVRDEYMNSPRKEKTWLHNQT